MNNLINKYLNAIEIKSCKLRTCYNNVLNIKVYTRNYPNNDRNYTIHMRDDNRVIS